MSVKSYRMKLTTKSPVFIGSGDKYIKKEYLYIPEEKKVILVNLAKLYEELQIRGFDKAYETFVIGGGRNGLYDFLKANQLLKRIDRKNYSKHEYSTEHTFINEHGLKDIRSFIKDPYGLPYIPGSSIKGGIRTALLSYRLNHHYDDFKGIYAEVWDATREEDENQKKNKYLKNQRDNMETLAFHNLKRIQERDGSWKNAVNSIMQGLIISDSNPLQLDDLFLSHRIKFQKGYTDATTFPTIDIFLEMLKPNVDIYFTLTMDDAIFPMNIDEIFKALNEFNDISNRAFYSKFRKENLFSNTLYLGGMVGFLSKTVVYPLFEAKNEEGNEMIFNYEDAVDVTDSIMHKMLGDDVYTDHHHNYDIDNGLSPHMNKCTWYQNKVYNTGVCTLTVDSEFSI